MNRTGGGMPIRGMPAGFGGQQQQQQQQQQSNRSVSNRLPNGGNKLGNNANSGWAFGQGMPMGGAGLPSQNRQMGGNSNVSFAQSLTGSSAATPLDLSEFPSLSNNAQLSNSNASTLWSSGGSRNLSGPVQRNQPTPLSQQQGQEDPFSPNNGNSRPNNNRGGAFRYGGQDGAQAAPQGQQSSGNSDEAFPPLGHNAGGEPGSESPANMMSSLGFGGGQQNAGGGGAAPGANDRGNGLLNALSANSRTETARSPPGLMPADSVTPAELKSPVQDQTSSFPDALAKSPQSLNPAGAIGPGNAAAGAASAGKLIKDDSTGPEGVDPLAGMSAIDKWGIKGLRTLMHNYPDYQSMVVGIDPSQLGIDLTAHEMVSTQIYSLYDDVPPRPTVANASYRVPDCYHVTNVQPIESKIQNFNEETLFWIFYSCPADTKQQLAAMELHARNWRWHRRMNLWLTKDEHMTPQVLSPTHERGYYIVWDTREWRKDRREFELHYGDLDNTLTKD